MKKRDAFSLMEVLVATMIFSFVALSMISVYYAANRNVLQNFRADKLKADVAISALERYVDNLIRLSQKFSEASRFLILTRNEEETISEKGVNIHVMPSGGFCWKSVSVRWLFAIRECDCFIAKPQIKI